MPQLPHLYLSGPAFLVSFADPNKQLFSVKSVLKILNYGFSLSEIHIFITCLWILISFIIQRPLKISGNA